MANVGELVAQLSVQDLMSQQVQDAMGRVERSVNQMADAGEASMARMQNAMTLSAFQASFLGNMLSDVAQKAIAFGKDLVTSSLMAGARLEQLGGVSRFLGEKAGYTADEIDNLATKIQRTGITGTDSRNAIVQLLGAHIDLSKAAQLSAVAQNMATISGESSSATYTKIIRGITTLQPELLKTAGFTVNLSSVMRDYTQATGKSAQGMDGQQKQLLLLNAVLKEGAEKAGLYGESMNYSSKLAGSSERVWEEVSEAIGTIFLPVTNVAIHAWYDLGTSIRNFVTEGSGSVEAFMQRVADGLKEVIEQTKKWAEAALDAGKTIYAAFNAIPDSIKSIGGELLTVMLALYAVNTAINVIMATKVVNWFLMAAQAIRVFVSSLELGMIAGQRIGIGALAGGWSVFASAITTALGPIGLITIAVVALGVVIYKFRDNLVGLYDAWQNGTSLWQGLKDGAMGAGDNFDALGNRIISADEAAANFAAQAQHTEGFVEGLGIAAVDMGGYVDGAGNDAHGAAKYVNELGASVDGATSSIDEFNGTPMTLHLDGTEIAKVEGFWAKLNQYLTDTTTFIQVDIGQSVQWLADRFVNIFKFIGNVIADFFDFHLKMVLRFVGLFTDALGVLPFGLEKGMASALDKVTQKLKDALDARHKLADQWRADNGLLPAITGDSGPLTSGGGKKGPKDLGPDLQPRDAAAAAADEALSKRQQAALDKYNEALKEYNNRTGKDYLSVLNQVGNAMYEGVTADLARGVSVGSLALIYRTTTKDIEMIKNAEADWQKKQTETIKSQEAFAKSVRSLTTDAVGAVKGLGMFGQLMPDLTRKTLDYSASLEAGEAVFTDEIDTLVRLGGVYDQFGNKITNAKDRVEALERSGRFMQATLESMGAKSLQGVLMPALKGSGEEIRHLKSEFDTFGDGLKSALAGIPALLQQAFTGGGGLAGAAKALGVSLGVVFAKALTDSIKANSGGISGAGLAGAAGTGALAGVGSMAGGATVGQSIANVAMASIAVTTSAAVAAGALTAGAIAAGAATAGIGLAAIGAYYGLKKLFSLSAEYKQAKVMQSDMVTSLLSIATAAEAAEGPMITLDKDGNKVNNTFQIIGTVGRDAFLQAGYSAQQTDLMVKKLLDTKNAKEFALAMKALGDAVAWNEKQTADLKSGTDDLVSAYQSAGSTIPTAMIDTIKSLLTMKGLTDDERKSLQGVVDAASPNYKALTEMAAGYGISLDALGPKFQQMNIESTAKQIFNDFTALTQAGADVGGVLLGMSSAISKLVDDSIKFGTAIPDNMKPLIDNLFNAGKLTDENGDAIKDISQLKFEGTPLDQGLDKLSKTIDHLAEVLGRIPGLAAAAGGSLAGVPTPPGEAPGPAPTDNYSNGLSYSGGNPVFSSTSQSANSGGSRTPMVVQVMLPDGRVLAETVVPELPGAMQRAGVGR